MHLAEQFRSGRFVLSIEIFPPKTAEGDAALQRSLLTLQKFRPAFLSCTYGAGGSTQERTLAWCREIQQLLGLPAMAHFTCVGNTVQELLSWLSTAAAAGVANIMALRGDPPAGQQSFQAVEGGLQHANELVSLIRQHFPQLGIGVAGYPEKHLEAPSLEADLENLKRKVDAGADAVFTQLFFVNENFLRFRDRCESLGIRVPIVPGIMPITDFARIRRITSMCGTVFPDSLAKRLEAVQDNPAAQFEIGVEHAIQQCEALRTSGVPGIHFYALNKSDACERILAALQLPDAEAQ
ncbi:MAG: 5,10-methylenetetrahydrofolate reductase [Planctomycetota bacterium]|jgi:methylenetetrahydrofolate reductase (NADPH)